MEARRRRTTNMTAVVWAMRVACATACRVRSAGRYQVPPWATMGNHGQPVTTGHRRDLARTGSDLLCATPRITTASQTPQRGHRRRRRSRLSSLPRRQRWHVLKTRWRRLLRMCKPINQRCSIGCQSLLYVMISRAIPLLRCQSLSISGRISSAPCGIKSRRPPIIVT